MSSGHKPRTPAGKMSPTAPRFAGGYFPSIPPGNFTYGSNSDTVIDLFRWSRERNSGSPGTMSAKSPTTPSAFLLKPTQILDFLFLGSQNDAADVAFIKHHRITDIINVSKLGDVAVSFDVTLHHFAVDDNATAPIESIFEQCFEVISRVRQQHYDCIADNMRRSTRDSSATPMLAPSVLVHCERGISRSSTIVIAYLVQENGWSVVEAFRFVQQRRSIIEPNCGFMDALRVFESAPRIQSLRTRRRKELVIALRNVAKGASEEAITAYFEKNVGVVWHVSQMENRELWFVFFAAAESCRIAHHHNRLVTSCELAADGKRFSIGGGARSRSDRSTSDYFEQITGTAPPKLGRSEGKKRPAQ